MRAWKILAATTALLAGSCTGSLLPEDAAAPLRPIPGQHPSFAAAAPRRVSSEVVFAPATPPALTAPESTGNGTVIHLGRKVRAVGADPEGSGDFDDGSWLPPVPPPPGVEPSAEEIPTDFLPAGEPAEGGPVFAEDPVEDPGWYDDGEYGEYAEYEEYREEPAVEVVEVAYYEVLEGPSVTTVSFGTPILVVDGYRSWGWGRFPAVRSAPCFDPCALPRGGAWWDSAYNPCWNPCYDPSWGSWEKWDAACRPDNIYLDRDGDRHHARGHDHRDREGATVVGIGGQRPEPAGPVAGGGGGTGADVSFDAPPPSHRPPVRARIDRSAPAPAERPPVVERRLGGGDAFAARTGSDEGAVGAPRTRTTPTADPPRPAVEAPASRGLPSPRLVPARNRSQEAAESPARIRLPSAAPAPAAPAREEPAGTFGRAPARTEPRTDPAPVRADPEPRRAPRAQEPVREDPQPRARASGGGGGASAPSPRLPAARPEPVRTAPVRPRADPAQAPQPRTGGGGTFGRRPEEPPVAPAPQGRRR